MTLVAIAIASVVCGWSVLLAISDERQRALASAQMNPAKAPDPAKMTGSEKRKN